MKYLKNHLSLLFLGLLDRRQGPPVGRYQGSEEQRLRRQERRRPPQPERQLADQGQGRMVGFVEPEQAEHGQAAAVAPAQSTKVESEPFARWRTRTPRLRSARSSSPRSWTGIAC